MQKSNFEGLGLGLYQAKTPMTLAYSISVYLRRNRVLMPCELSESSSPDQAGSIQPSFSSRPLCDLLSLTNGLTDTWLQLLSTPVSSQIMLSSEKEFTAEKTLLQFYFGLASGLLFF